MKNKIALISAHTSPISCSGDMEDLCCRTQLGDLAKALSQKDYDVDIYTRRDSLELDEIVYFYPHVRIINILAGPAKPISTEELFMYMDEFGDMMLDIISDHNIQYQIIHAHFWMSGYVGLKIKQELAIPLVVNIHTLSANSESHIAPRVPIKQSDIEDEVIWHADRVVAKSQVEYTELIKHHHVDPEKVEVIPFGELIEASFTAEELPSYAVSTSQSALSPRKKYRQGENVWAYTVNKLGQLYDRLTVPKPSRTMMRSYPLLVKDKLNEAAALFKLTAEMVNLDVVDAAHAISEALRKGRKVLVCGSDGSGTGSQHFATEILRRSSKENKSAHAVLSLHADQDTWLAWANGDEGHEIFARQVDAWGNAGDILVCLNSGLPLPQVIQALRQARKKEMVCINLTGQDNNQLLDLGHHNLVVPSTDTARVREIHLHIIHTLCELVEEDLGVMQSDDREELKHGMAV